MARDPLESRKHYRRMTPMIKATDTSLAEWEVDARDDARFVGCAQRLVAAAAALGAQRDILVVHIDNWFGVAWLGFTKGYVVTHGRYQKGEPYYRIPPFHPNRVLSARRYELREDGVLLGPFQPARSLAQMDTGESFGSFQKNCEPGIYAWYSGNTKANDRAALMVYTHAIDGTSAWYAEFRRTDGCRLSRRIGIGDADWRRLLEIGGVAELE